MTSRDQWVLWKNVVRNGEPTKVPFQVNGDEAKANDPTTWNTLEACAANVHGYEGVGYEFSADDPYTGVDLDGCRNPKTGDVAEWAREIILSLKSYAEVSPSQTGVKIFCIAKSPFDTGRKQILSVPKVGAKQPAIEVYDQKRYFAVTGQRLAGMYELRECQEELNQVCEKYFPKREAFRPHSGGFQSELDVIERARKYIALIPGAVSGQGGHPATFRVSCVLVKGFGLADGDAYRLLCEFNQRCEPPWSERELQHKIKEARKQPGEENYLRHALPEHWDAIDLPDYTEQREQRQPPRKPEVRVTTLKQATLDYIDRIESGNNELIELGLGEVDSSIGGGVEFGEMVVMAARPSHGKSCVGLQAVHTWTGNGRPAAIISEEMVALALGKRTLQYLSDEPQEHWFHRGDALRNEATGHFSKRAECRIVECCRSAEAAAEAIRKAHREINIQCAVVDYLQLLKGVGKSRYEQVTDASMCLRQVANETKIALLVLAQLSREVERRNQFVPCMADLKESGQIEQDADVIIFLVWPWMLDHSKHVHDYQFLVSKNRNRAIHKYAIATRFIPSRQMILPEALKRNAYLDTFSAASSAREDGF